MTIVHRLLGKSLLILVALASLALLPAQVSATGIGFRNEMDVPVLIQGTSNINGMIRRGQPVILLPGRTGLDQNVPPGPRQITIYDANQPNRVLLQTVVPVPLSGQNLYFSIRPASAPGPYPIELVPQRVGN
jgi:hypothetical protein